MLWVVVLLYIYKIYVPPTITTTTTSIIVVVAVVVIIIIIIINCHFCWVLFVVLLFA